MRGASAARSPQRSARTERLRAARDAHDLPQQRRRLHLEMDPAQSWQTVATHTTQDARVSEARTEERQGGHAAHFVRRAPLSRAVARLWAMATGGRVGRALRVVDTPTQCGAFVSTARYWRSQASHAEQLPHSVRQQCTLSNAEAPHPSHTPSLAPRRPTATVARKSGPTCFSCCAGCCDCVASHLLTTRSSRVE